MTKKEILEKTLKETEKTTAEYEKALQALVSQIITAKTTLKTISKTIDDITSLFKEGLRKGGNWKALAKILLVKVDNTTFYQKYLKAYYEDNGVCFQYNVKKDRLYYFGDILSITQTFEEWKEENKKPALSTNEKVERQKKTLSTLFKSLSDEQKESLKKWIASLK